MLREEGTLAMFKGLLPRLLYVAPFGAVQVFVFGAVRFKFFDDFNGLLLRLLYVAPLGAVQFFFV